MKFGHLDFSCGISYCNILVSFKFFIFSACWIEYVVFLGCRGTVCWTWLSDITPCIDCLIRSMPFGKLLLLAYNFERDYQEVTVKDECLKMVNVVKLYLKINFNANMLKRIDSRIKKIWLSQVNLRLRLWSWKEPSYSRRTFYVW